MILLCAGQRDEQNFDALLTFAAALSDAGQEVVIDSRSMPEQVFKNQKYEAAPFLAEAADIDPTTVIVLGSQSIGEETQTLLRSLRLGPEVDLLLIGRFANYQDELTATNRIAFACGHAPRCVNLADFQPHPLLERARAPLAAPVSDAPKAPTVPGTKARVVVYLPPTLLENPSVLPQLNALGHLAGVDLHLLSNSKGKTHIRNSPYSAISVFSYGELPPRTLARQTDIAVFFGDAVPGERMAAFALDVMAAGKVVVDCTSDHAFITTGAPAVAGDPEPAALSAFLSGMVLELRDEIGRRALKNDWLAQFDIGVLLGRLGLEAAPERAATRGPHTLFFPTNGNGLGHAQRCALVAEAMPDHANPVFAAYPSCVDLLQSRGFSCQPMVSRSADHSDEYSGDLVNLLRLRAQLQPHDHLVFDGGYVFDSVYRTIAELQLKATWVRRGLWQAGQVHATALERERVFSQVIVPQEAFAELNTQYSFGPKLHQVGPIVAQSRLGADEARKMREAIANHFRQPCDTLVVTMLGGGVASNRASQIQLLASLMERRANTLHLVVAWPNAVIANGVYGWKNTKVVSTKQASRLAQAADLVVSAAGYNSFHELIYANAPTIFIPQYAPYLDDQEKRARAAHDRDIASLVLEHETVLLEREVAAFLDDGKGASLTTAFENASLPEPGNDQAAALIMSEAKS